MLYFSNAKKKTQCYSLGWIFYACNIIGNIDV